jgi:hypothetical protein
MSKGSWYDAEDRKRNERRIGFAGYCRATGR